MMVAGAVSAALPIPFTSWTANGGVINATCPASAVCSAPSVVDDGFMMREVRVGGYRYFQTILTDPGVTGNPASAPFSAGRGNVGFTSENFVRPRLGNPEPGASPVDNAGSLNGFADKTEFVSSTMTSPTTEERVVHSAIYRMLWAADSAAESVSGLYSTININFNQVISTVDYSGATPIETFKSGADLAWDVGRTYNLNLDQSLNLGTGEVQKFKHRDLAGAALTGSRVADPSNPLLPGGTNGGDFGWALGAEIAVTWIGQSTSAGGPFGNTRYWGSTPTIPNQTTLASLTNPNPASWVSVFGPAPVFNATAVVLPAAALPPLTLPATIAAVAPLSGTGGAGPPIAFDGWTVSGGSIALTAACPVGAVCEILVTGDGFVQRSITTLAGHKYFQTIIAGANATGDPTVAAFEAGSIGFSAASPGISDGFSDETFVRVGINGIAAKLDFAFDDRGLYSGGNWFDLASLAYSSTINTGWAQGGAADPTLILSQAFNTHAVPGPGGGGSYNPSTFTMSFNMKMLQDQSSDIAISHITDSTATIPIGFATRIIKGSLQTSAHTANPLNPILPKGTNGGDINWAAGESIQAVWVGGRYEVPPMAFTSLSVNRTTAYKNLTTGAATSSTEIAVNNDGTWPSLSPDPASWVNPFGPPAPTLKVIQILPPP